MEIRKAITFRASSIGDCLMAKYLLDNIHAQFPQARCGVVVASRGSMVKDLLKAYPWIEVMEVNRRNPKALLALWRHWRGSDLVVTQYAGKPGGTFSFFSKYFARMLSRRGGFVGFADASNSNWIFDHKIDGAHERSPAEDEREVLRAVGLPVVQAYPSLVTPEEQEALQRLGLKRGQYVLVHLFSGSAKRGLHPDKRRALVKELRTALPKEIEIVLTGTASEASEAAAAAGSDARVIAGEASLQETGELIAQAAAVVSLDTGVAHMAAQMHRPVLVISTCMGLWWWNTEQYGPETPFKVFTINLHSITKHPLEDYPACLNSVSLRQIALEVSQLDRL